MIDPSEARFTRLYESHYPAVLAYCARRVGVTEAEEVANDVFAVLWRHIDGFDDESPLPWLYRVAHGSIRNRWKSDRRRRRLEDRLGGLRHRMEDPADDVVVRREHDQIVLSALASLRPADQEVLRLSIWEKLTAPQIAAVIDCSVSAAEQRLHRAKKRLAHALTPALDPISSSGESIGRGGLA